MQTPLFTRLPAAAFLLGLLRSPGPRTPDQDTVVFPADVCHHAALAARTLKSEDNDTQETPRCPTEPLPKGSQKPPGRKQPRPTVSPTFAQDDSVSSPATAAAADTHSSPRCQRRSPAPVGRKLQWRGRPPAPTKVNHSDLPGNCLLLAKSQVKTCSVVLVRSMNSLLISLFLHF